MVFASYVLLTRMAPRLIVLASGALVLVVLGLTGCSSPPSKTVSATSITTTVESSPSSSATASTSTTLLTRIGAKNGDLAQHIFWVSDRILIPTGWVEHDLIPGGSSETASFSDPTSASMLVLGLDACASCGFTTSGQPRPQNYLPTSGVTSSTLLDPYRLSYVQKSQVQGYVTDGLIVDVLNGTEPNGTITVAVTLPVAQHDLATTILNSLQIK